MERKESEERLLCSLTLAVESSLHFASFLPHVLSCAVNEPLPIALLVKKHQLGKKINLEWMWTFCFERSRRRRRRGEHA